MMRWIPCLFLFACQSATQGNTTDPVDTIATSVANSPVAADISGCYLAVLQKDTAHLHLQVSGTTLQGDLAYNHFEKDDNIGTIQGEINDNVITAYYSFQSEGSASVRQVVFKVEKDQLVEGFGEIIMKGDTAIFKDINYLEYPFRQVFNKIPCKQ